MLEANMKSKDYLFDFDPHQPFVLIENPLQLFFAPVEEVKVFDASKIKDSFNRVEKLSQSHYYLAGYVSYEAFHSEYSIDLSKKAQALDATMVAEMPLLYFHAFSKRVFLSSHEFDEQILPKLIQAELASPHMLKKNQPTLTTTEKVKLNPPVVYNFKSNEDFDSYCRKVNHIIHDELKNGNTYQVNFTFKNKFQLQGKVYDIFNELGKYQPVAGAGLYHFDFDICSYSLELFINKKGDLLTAKPMKGTARRGANSQEDAEIMEKMRNDSKILSENLIIVDLLRNDLGQVAEPCSVEVPKLFDIETYATLFQMTSTIQARVSSSLSFYDIFKALFPCGSITGAPKKRTMHIIDKLENERRNLYTGAIGYLEPSGDFQFNVGIRSVVINQSNEDGLVGELGIGSGIVYESKATEEWEECHLKSQFVKLINSSFQLIETFGYESATHNYRYLDLHLKRLQKSANIFSFKYSIESIIKELEALKIQLHSLYKDKSIYRIRLLLFQNGKFELNHSELEPSPAFYRLALCKTPVNSKSVFQHHKTTCRKLYDDFYKMAHSKGFDEILFFNEKNFCVEGSRHTLVIKKEGQFFTPSLSDGALPGVLRHALFNDPQYMLMEKSLSLKDLQDADEVYLANSLRGVIRAEVVEQWLNAEALEESGEE